MITTITHSSKYRIIIAHQISTNLLIQKWVYIIERQSSVSQLTSNAIKENEKVTPNFVLFTNYIGLHTHEASLQTYNSQFTEKLTKLGMTLEMS